MNILGISAFFHDAAAALVQDGVVVAAAEEERFSRIKHDPEFPQHAIDFCLRTGSISAEDLDYVVFYEKPFLKFERILMSTLQSSPKSFRVFKESMVKWLSQKLWVKSLIANRLGIAPDRVLFSSHHMSHAASAYYCSPYSEAAVLTVDGVGEWATASMGVGRGNSLELLSEIRFPHSLGLLYSVFTAFLGFEVNEGEYKVMGMAPYGKPRYVDDVRKLIRLSDDGAFAMDMDYFSYHRSPDTAFAPKFEKLFGTPRKPGAHFFTEETGYPDYFGARPADYAEQVRQNQHYADIAASIQRVTEEIVLGMARAAHAKTGLTKLCMAGGVALNSVANGRIIRETPFDEIYIQPAAGDGGGAIGAALYVHHAVLGHPRTYVMDHAYLGEEHGADAIRTFLREQNIRHEYMEDEDRLMTRVSEALTEGKVIGWSQGRFEWGPRALGNRSILADPRRADMKDIVNTKIKFREPYRPFAPSVLVEHAHEFYDLKDPERHHAARFMLLVVPVKEEKRAVVPAPTHMGTARLQTVFKETNPRYHKLIETFGKATGVPVVMNTSFNLKGEAIVNTPEQAYSTFSRSGIDMLVLDRYLVEKVMKKVVIVTCMTLMLLGALELGLRTWAYFFRHSYQRFDVASGIIRLVPNYDRVLQDGRVRVLKGFRGAEFDAQKPNGVYRIFAIGDSTTFGLPGDTCPYPAQLEQRLNRPGAGRRFEVVNAGVEGYNSRDALTVLERDIVRYQPDMVTLYIGWNDMMKHDPGNPGASARFARMSYALYDVYLIKFWRKVMFAWVRPRLQTVQTELPAEAARAYDGYTPHVFKENLERMIDVASTTGARVVLVTLPSPLRPEMPAAEIKKLYFPYYTHNLKAFHLIYGKYNDTIREVAQRRGLPVLDLQVSLEGRGDLFFDTAHMECEGHAVVAEQFTSLFERAGVVTPATGAVAGGSR